MGDNSQRENPLSNNEDRHVYMKLIEGGLGKVSQCDFLAALLLCVLFGVFGLHRFYVGRYYTGFLQLCTFGGFGVWTMIDLFLIASGSFTDGEGLPITTR